MQSINIPWMLLDFVYRKLNNKGEFLEEKGKELTRDLLPNLFTRTKKPET